MEPVFINYVWCVQMQTVPTVGPLGVRPCFTIDDIIGARCLPCDDENHDRKRSCSQSPPSPTVVSAWKPFTVDELRSGVSKTIQSWTGTSSCVESRSLTSDNIFANSFSGQRAALASFFSGGGGGGWCAVGGSMDIEKIDVVQRMAFDARRKDCSPGEK